MFDKFGQPNGYGQNTTPGKDLPKMNATPVNPLSQAIQPLQPPTTTPGGGAPQYPPDPTLTSWLARTGGSGPINTGSNTGVALPQGSIDIPPSGGSPFPPLTGGIVKPYDGSSISAAGSGPAQEGASVSSVGAPALNPAAPATATGGIAPPTPAPVPHAPAAAPQGAGLGNGWDQANPKAQALQNLLKSGISGQAAVDQLNQNPATAGIAYYPDKGYYGIDSSSYAAPGASGLELIQRSGGGNGGGTVNRRFSPLMAAVGGSQTPSANQNDSQHQYLQQLLANLQ